MVPDECFRCSLGSLVGPERRCLSCAQVLPPAGVCENSLCQRGDIELHWCEAIAEHRDAFKDAIRRQKYQGKHGWNSVFGAILLGYLSMSHRPSDFGLIMANPPSPGRTHTLETLRAAKTLDVYDLWPFDDPDSPAVVKTAQTQRSAGAGISARQLIGEHHAQACAPVHRERFAGKWVLVYDDVMTTGSQLNALAKRLKEWGAAGVCGVVLARRPWN